MMKKLRGVPGKTSYDLATLGGEADNAIDGASPQTLPPSSERQATPPLAAKPD